MRTHIALDDFIRRAADINVECNKGVVTLSGRVRDGEERDRVVRLARRV